MAIFEQSFKYGFLMAELFVKLFKQSSEQTEVYYLS